MKELEPSSSSFFCRPLLPLGRAIFYYISFIRSLLIPEGHCPFAHKTSLSSRTTANLVNRPLTSL